MARVGIMGGTFDPIHIGHLIAAETAREICELDEVWFIPTAAPPLKADSPDVGAKTRYEMVRAAVNGHDSFLALDIELRRGGISYSYDTVAELQSLYPEHSFLYIIGSDRVNDLPKWSRIEKLAELVRFIGLQRPSEELQLGSLPRYLRERLQIAPMPAIGISSTDIRAKLATGRSVRYLVPEPVYEYIRRNGLYGAPYDH